MSRRGGKRRPVLDLGGSSKSKLHRYGYSKELHSGKGGLPSLVGDYANSESDEDEETQLDIHSDTERTVSPAPVASGDNHDLDQEVKVEASGDMDDELRHFLSEIESIPMPEEATSDDVPSATGASSEKTWELNAFQELKDKKCDEIEEPSQEEEKDETDLVPKKAEPSRVYSMFVKGEPEFVNSPSRDAGAGDSVKSEDLTSAKKKDEIEEDLPEEPVTSWQMVQDETSQYYYYWNTVTNEVTWEIPTGYTQFLLLHREYQERIAKYTPEQLQRIKDRKLRKTKVNGPKQEQMAGASLPKAADSKEVSSVDELRRLGKEGEKSLLNSDSISFHKKHRKHEKKKKSKKHKYKRDDDSSAEEGKGRSQKKPMIGPALEEGPEEAPVSGPKLPSIVPYLSDQEDDEGDTPKKSDSMPVLGPEPDDRLTPHDSPKSDKVDDSEMPVLGPEVEDHACDSKEAVDNDLPETTSTHGKEEISCDSEDPPKELHVEDIVKEILSIDEDTAKASPQMQSETTQDRIDDSSDKCAPSSVVVSLEHEQTNVRTAEPIPQETDVEKVTLMKEGCEEEPKSVLLKDSSQEDDDISRADILKVIENKKSQVSSQKEKEVLDMFAEFFPSENQESVAEDLKMSPDTDNAHVALDNAEMEPMEEGEIAEGLEMSDAVEIKQLDKDVSKSISQPLKSDKSSSKKPHKDEKLATVSDKKSHRDQKKSQSKPFSLIASYGTDEEEGELKESDSESSRQKKKESQKEMKKKKASSSKAAKPLVHNDEAVKGDNESVGRKAEVKIRDKENVHKKEEGKIRDKDTEIVHKKEEGKIRDKDTEIVHKKEEGRIRDKDTTSKKKEVNIHDKDTGSKKDEVKIKDKNTASKKNEHKIRAKDTTSKRDQVKIRDKDTAKRKDEAKIRDKDTAKKRNEVKVKNKDTAKKKDEVKVKDKDIVNNKDDVKVKNKDVVNKKAEDKARNQDIVKKKDEVEVTEKETANNNHEVKVTDVEMVDNKDEAVTPAIEDADPDDFDLDDIDRALELALEKKLEQKKVELHDEDSRPSTEAGLTNGNEIDKCETSDHKDESETKCETLTSEEDLKSVVRDIADVALSKLEFLDIGTDNLSRLQVLFIELQTRLSDWTAGGLTTEYFQQQLLVAEGLLEQYELSAVPEGWVCQWDRGNNRYFYRHKETGHKQWEYPEVKEEVLVKRKESRKTSNHDDRKTSSHEDRSRDEVDDRKGRSSKHKKREKEERSKYDKHDKRSSSRRHHRKRKRRRDHSSSSDGSGEETQQQSSKYQHKNKRKKTSRSRARTRSRSPSIEILEGLQDEIEIREISSSPEAGSNAASPPPPEVNTPNSQPTSPLPSLPTSTGTPAEEDSNMADGEAPSEPNLEMQASDTIKEVPAAEEGVKEDIDGVEMMEAVPEEEVEEEKEEEVNPAVISRPPQLSIPPHVAASQPAELYSAPPAPPAAPAVTVPSDAQPEAEASHETDADKQVKKKKKEKKSLSTSSSMMLKKKQMNTMVQKWQRVKKQVEKEEKDKEIKQAAIRQKIADLK